MPRWVLDVELCITTANIAVLQCAAITDQHDALTLLADAFLCTAPALLAVPCSVFVRDLIKEVARSLEAHFHVPSFAWGMEEHPRVLVTAFLKTKWKQTNAPTPLRPAAATNWSGERQTAMHVSAHIQCVVSARQRL